jgi:hypothetical protein
MGGRGMAMFGGPGAVVTGAPYSGVEVVESQETLADGNTITRKRQTDVYRDGQGRIRMEETITPNAASGKPPYTIVTILDYVGGFRYVLDSATMKAYQSPLRAPRNPRTANGATPPSRPNVVQTSLGSQTVNGVLATGTQYTETIPAGAIGNARPIQVTRVVWISNDLKVPVQIKSSDPRFGSTDMELTNIAQAEPSASLFVVPAGYTVQSGFGGPGGPGPRRGGRAGGPPPPQN